MAKLALGTAQFGLNYGISNRTGQTARGEVTALLAQAAAEGVVLLDTAPAYGTAEAVLGKVGTDAFQVVSKLPAGTRPAEVAAAIAKSLAALRRDRVDGYIVHNATDLLGPDGPALWSALEKARAKGQVGKIGASISTPDELKQLLERFPLELVQQPLNPIDARWEAAGTMDVLAAAGVELHTRSAFLQGLLLMASPPPELAEWAPLLARFRDWCAARGVAPVDACLGHVLAQPSVSQVVVGITSAQELSQALRATPDPTLLPAELRSLDPVLLNPTRWPQ